MKYQSVPYLILAFLIVFCFIVFDPYFKGGDDGVYFAYTKSIVEDGDLNVVNQMCTPGIGCAVTGTFNYPDFHNHGGIVLWVPYYLYGKLIYHVIRAVGLTIPPEVNEQYVITCSLSFGTVMFGIIIMILSFLVLRKFFSLGISCVALVLLFFGTPFFYFVLFENGNANIIAGLFAAILIWYSVCIMEIKRTHLILLGLFVSLCAAIKVDLWFIIFFIAPFLVIKTYKSVGRLGDIVFFAAGMIPGIVLKVTNDYLKYGMFYSGEMGLINIRFFYLFEQIFSPYHGFVYTSPLLGVCFGGLLLSVASMLRRRFSSKDTFLRDMTFVCLGTYLCVKIIMISFRFSWGGGTPGARILLSEFMVLSLLYARAFSINLKYIRLLLYGLSVIAVVWNMIVIGEFMTGADLHNLIKPDSLLIRIKSLNTVFLQVFSPKDIKVKLLYLLPLIIFITGGILVGVNKLFVGKSRNLKNVNEIYRTIGSRYFCLFTLYVFAAYAFFTACNLINNKRNVTRMQQEGTLRNHFVVGKEYFDMPENLASMDEMILYYTLRGRGDVVAEIKKIVNHYTNSHQTTLSREPKCYKVPTCDSKDAQK